MARFVWLVLLIGAASAAVAATDDDWEAGRTAYAAGDYESALVFFQTAHAAGLDSPAVHYNIAVTQFRLGRYQDAGRTFELIAQRFPKMRGLAEYNLGLVALRLAEEDRAVAHFRRAYQLSSANPKLRALASQQLGSAAPRSRPTPVWSGVVGLRAGNDDNVTLRDEAGLPMGTTTDSPLVDGFVAVSGPWQANGGLRLEATAYVVRYADATDFDQYEIQGGAIYEWRPGDWRIQLGVHASAGGLGGESFDRKAGMRARLTWSLTEPSDLDLRLQYDNVDEADAIFAGMAGSRQRVDVRYRWHRDDHRVNLSYWVETNDRQDPGVSPRRSRFGIEYRNLPARGVGFEAGIDLRNSDYDDLSTPRGEELKTFSGALTYAFRTRWRLRLELLHSNNDSTDEGFTYDRNRVTLGATRNF